MPDIDSVQYHALKCKSKLNEVAPALRQMALSNPCSTTSALWVIAEALEHLQRSIEHLEAKVEALKEPNARTTH